MLLSPKQTEFVRGADCRWNFKGGATRSGKTYLDFRWVIPMRIRERAGRDGLIVILGVTKSTIERNVLEPMRNIYGSDLVGNVSSDNTVWLFGEKCYALGAEKVSQVSKIRGASIKYCYGDEVADWSEEVFELLKSRLDKEYSCFDGTFNPQYPGHWLERFLASDADIFSQTYTIDDNPFLPASFKENLKKEYAGTVFYNRYILGLWTAAEGAVYPQFAAEPERFIRDDAPSILYATIGVDFGGTGSAHSFTLTGFTERMQQVIVLDEYYHNNKKQGVLSPKELEDAFVDFVRRSQMKYRVYEARCDSAEQTLIQGLRIAAARNGLGIEIRDAIKGPINDRIAFYNSMMAQGRFFIMRHCKASIDAFQSAVYDSKKQEDVRLDDGSTNIDSLDSAEYTTEPIQNDILYLGLRGK